MNHRGFGSLVIILVIVVIAIVAVGGVWYYKSQQSYQSSAVQTYQSSTSPATPLADGLNANASEHNSGAQIRSLSVTAGPIGTSVTIIGVGFDGESAAILFGTTTMEAYSQDGKTLSFTVPDGVTLCNYENATKCPSAIPGHYSVSVATQNHGTSNTIDFTVMQSASTDWCAGQGPAGSTGKICALRGQFPN
jgi:hypothetical protein